MDANRLLVFDAVVRAGSFAAASRVLGVSRQAVSEQIAKLEAQLEVRLLDRNTRNLHVTDAGRRLAERSHEVAQLVREAEAEVVGLQGQPVGRLRVSVPGAFGRLFMAPVAARLLRLHPGLTLEARITDREVNLVEEGFDAAVRVGELDDSSLVRRKLGSERLVFVVGPRVVEQHGLPTADGLSSYPTIGLRRTETWNVEGRAVGIEPRLVLDDLQAVAAAAIEGIGAARLPRFAVRSALRDGRLQTCFDDEVLATRQLWVVHPSRRFVPAKVRCFVEALTEHVRETFA